MKKLPIKASTLALLVVIIPLLALFIYVGLRSGPLAPTEVTLVSVESRVISPALFGIGTVEAQYTYKIGPTSAGRIKTINVQVGDRVNAGQILGEMEQIDLNEKLHAQEASFIRAKAVLQEAKARQTYAQTQADRYERLFSAQLTSEEMVTAKRQELQITQAALAVNQADITRVDADRKAVLTQQNNLRLVAPLDGVVVERSADPGTTIVAGQAVLEIIDPQSLWINVRFDQISARELASGLNAKIDLRSRGGQSLNGKVLRVELKADAVTEEMLAKVSFNLNQQSLPPLGELAEVTVELPARQATLSVPNAAIHRASNKVGVWRVNNNELEFVALKLGASDLNGFVQVIDGLNKGDRIVLYTAKALSANSRISVVEAISGLPQ